MTSPPYRPSKSRVTKAGELLRAHRLGTELLEAESYVTERGVIEDFRALHAQPLTRVAAGLRYYVREASGRSGWEVGQRLKAMPTILDKLTRQPGMELGRMHDIGGCRGILPNQDAVDQVIDRLRGSHWKLRPKMYDYVATPKDDGYRAKHLVAVKDGALIEIQLRTDGQHFFAELVERTDRQHHLDLKAGRADDKMRIVFAHIADLIDRRDREIISPVEFRDELVRLTTRDASS